MHFCGSVPRGMVESYGGHMLALVHSTDSPLKADAPGNLYTNRVRSLLFHILSIVNLPPIYSKWLQLNSDLSLD